MSTLPVFSHEIAIEQLGPALQHFSKKSQIPLLRHELLPYFMQMQVGDCFRLPVTKSQTDLDIWSICFCMSGYATSCTGTAFVFKCEVGPKEYIVWRDQ